MTWSRKVDFAALPWQAGSPGLRFKAAVRDGKQIRLVEIDPGVEQDWCVTGHVGYVLEGVLELGLAGSVSRLGPGQGFFLASGQAGRHRPRAVGGVVRLILVEDVDSSRAAD